ncbi:unnamed protein product [Euphydryas editha]|uniref:Uncharacterized protein n=1 Tax=Euphydryas editha TaxID=104508 RepID=A0AAU9VD98_EUPED|nr:unnamed protein product [Euphydryas editha]
MQKFVRKNGGLEAVELRQTYEGHDAVVPGAAVPRHRDAVAGPARAAREVPGRFGGAASAASSAARRRAARARARHRGARAREPPAAARAAAPRAAAPLQGHHLQRPPPGALHALEARAHVRDTMAHVRASRQPPRAPPHPALPRLFKDITFNDRLLAHFTL